MAWIAVLVLLAGVSLTAAADDDLPEFTPSNENLLVLRDIGAQSPRGAPGDTVRIVLPLAVNQEEVPTENFRLTNITIEPDITEDWPFDVIHASYLRPLRDMSFNDAITIFYDFRISQRAARGVYPINFTISATVWRDAGPFGASIAENVTFTVGVHVTITEDGHEAFPPAPVAVGGPLEVAGTVDGRGIVPTPIGRPGEFVTMHIPVVNMGGRLTDITVAPVVSGDVEEFPFVAQHLNYGRNLADMANGAEVTLDFTFRVSPYATSGIKIIEFRAIHRENGILGISTFTSHIQVVDGFEEAELPVITITGYELLVNDESVPRLMAGDNAVLRVSMHNHSAAYRVYNIAVAINLPNHDSLTLTSGHSDTAFADRLEPGTTQWLDFHITARGAAPSGPSPIRVELNFTNAESVSDTRVQSIVIPIRQPVRLLIDEPIIFGQQREGMPIVVNLNVINMGRGRLYNLNVTAADGIRMYESFFGGDLLPAGTLDADVQVVSPISGEFIGRLLLNFEDSDGELFTEEIYLRLNVAPPPPPPQPEPPPPPPAAGAAPGVVNAAATGLTLLGAGSGVWYYLKVFRGRRMI